jgi:hypothetical protein
MSSKKLFLGIWLALATPVILGAALYKCEDAQGRITFSSQNCPAGAKSAVVSYTEESVTGQPGAQIPPEYTQPSAPTAQGAEKPVPHANQ